MGGKDKHKIHVELDVTAGEATLLQENLKKVQGLRSIDPDRKLSIAEEIEIKREIGIMREVLNEKGKNFDEKVENTLKRWNGENVEVIKENKRYKIKYR